MLIKLKTDFYDYYDHVFDRVYTEQPKYNYTFNRYADYQENMPGHISRPDMFKLMNQYKIPTPSHGFVEELYYTLQQKYNHYSRLFFNEMLYVVIYENIYSHRGEGKIKVPIHEAIRKYEGYYASEFIPTSQSEKGSSYRYLRIGTKQFWLHYLSDNWRSNYGNVKISIAKIKKELSERAIIFPDLPLIAFDFILNENKLYGIDVNVSPGLRGTGIEKTLSPKEIRTTIENYIKLTR